MSWAATADWAVATKSRLAITVGGWSVHADFATGESGWNGLLPKEGIE